MEKNNNGLTKRAPETLRKTVYHSAYRAIERNYAFSHRVISSTFPIWIAIIVTVISLVFVRRLSLSPDIADLLPTANEGAHLRDFVRVFGRGDVASLLVSGANPLHVQQACEQAIDALRACDKVRAAVDRVQFDTAAEPTLVWAMVGPKGHEKLKAALEPNNMTRRLRQSKRLLLTPGATALISSIQTDPLRLRTLPFEDQVQITGAAKTTAASQLAPEPLGTLVADSARARLILLSAKGQSLRGQQARDFVQAVNKTVEPIRNKFPDVAVELTGSHAIAMQTEHTLRRDLYISGALSTLLVSLAFVLTFRRTRALIAILPPLGLGTLWTSAAAYLVFEQVSALTLGFIAVVVGVGLDTGVHVYASLLEGKRAGLSRQEAVAYARKHTGKQTLTAALTAAIAFGSLLLSRIPALQQFGVLCAVGELVTALAILALTPWIGAWLEQKSSTYVAAPWWISRCLRCLDTYSRLSVAPLLVAIGAFIPLYVFTTLGPPKLGDTLVVIRPNQLEALQVQDKVNEKFGGGEGQWVVMLRDNDEPTVRSRADKVFDVLDSAGDHVTAVDGLTRFAPSSQTQRHRLEQRDKLDLPSKALVLQRLLVEHGFDADAFSATLKAMTTPSYQIRDALANDTQANRMFRARYLAHDHDNGQVWIAMYVRVRPGSEAAVQKLIATADSGAIVTGYARLESVLANAVRSDLPKVMAVASVLVAIAILLSLRCLKDGLIALAALGLSVAWVLALARWLPLPIHIYNAFILPVLLGISVDEVIFLLHRKQHSTIRTAVQTEGPVVIVTALTTSAGFLALVACSFQGLRDMGVLGTLGSVSGLLAALWVVPVLVRWTSASVKHN